MSSIFCVRNINLTLSPQLDGAAGECCLSVSPVLLGVLRSWQLCFLALNVVSDPPS